MGTRSALVPRPCDVALRILTFQGQSTICYEATFIRASKQRHNMTTKAGQRALNEFRNHLDELSGTWYEGDISQAFRHAAFQTIAPDPNLSDEQVIELTAIDHSGDLEIDGWFVDEQSETVFLFQSMGGETPVREDKVAKFWEAPEEVLNPQRVAASSNQLVKELSEELDARIGEEYSIAMVFAARGGFARVAKRFADSRRSRERPLKRISGETTSCQCTLRLFDLAEVAQSFDDFKFRTGQIDVKLTVDPNLIYKVNLSEGMQSIRATVSASEIVRVFETNRYKLFDLNPRGPLANAKVNKNISKTLDTSQGRAQFHLLNNGMCSTCDHFDIDENGVIAVKNFQIVNGCQTTVTLSKRSNTELLETLVDLKLVVANQDFAQNIAEASNSQTALRAKDFTSFERQQLNLQHEFSRLQPPWYYEIKQGYWRFVLSDTEKARFLTGRRKRHIEVQPLAQSSLAFIGYPSDALDRVRYVFSGIRSQEDRVWYDRAFPQNVNARQIILPWILLQNILRQKSPAIRFSNFHTLWLIARMLRDHYRAGEDQYFSSGLTDKLANSVEDWFPDRYRIASASCQTAYRRARNISGEELDVRDFFRGNRNYGGATITALIMEAMREEVEIANSRFGNELDEQLPT